MEIYGNALLKNKIKYTRGKTFFFKLKSIRILRIILKNFYNSCNKKKIIYIYL